MSSSTIDFDSLTLPEKAELWAAETDFAAIPIIDLTDATSTDFAKRKELAIAIQKACLTAGFFYVKNHGVDQTLLDKEFSLVRDLFALPHEIKNRIEISKVPSFRGWQDVLRSKTADDHSNKSYAGDLVEAFSFGNDVDICRKLGFGAEAEAAMAPIGNSQWLSQDDWDGATEFRNTTYQYFGALLDLAHRLLPLFALALDLPEDWFADKCRTNFANSRLLYYPPLEGRPADGQPGIGAHRDWQLFTILLQDQVGGLEVQNLAGDWVQATPIPGTFVINIGNTLSRWTNHVFRSTMHRVRPPPAHTARQSSPLFFGLDPTVNLEAIETCVSPERPFTDKVITSGEYIQEQLDRVYNLKLRGQAGGYVEAGATAAAAGTVKTAA